MSIRVAATALLSLCIATASAHAGADPDAACKEAKAKATGRKAASLLKAFGRNNKKADAPKLDAAIAKAQSKFTKAFTKAEAKGGCQTEDDSDTLEQLVDAYVTDSVSQVDGPLDYSDDATWLCKPGIANDQCLVNNIDATEFLPNGSQVVEVHQPENDPDFDCFYVYPTVDLSGGPANNDDLSDITLELDPLLEHAARFTKLCRVFAPFYRQITIGTFGAVGAQSYLNIAYRDVEAAFDHYLDNFNNDRNFVIMGHSQGTFMTTRLIEERIDDDAALRSRLIVALLIGGGVFVPEGQTIGGTFQNLPLCTADAETGCVIAYRSYHEDFPPAGGSNVQSGPGTDTACTNPAALGGGAGKFAGTYLRPDPNQIIFDVIPNDPVVGTDFLLYTDFYEGECIKDDQNRSYLEIRVRPGIGDVRTNLINFSHFALQPALLGTHILDYQFGLGDLLQLVATKAAAMP